MEWEKHMIKNIFNYLRWSNIILSLSLNPATWRVRAVYHGPSDMDPKMHLFVVKLIFVKLVIKIDDGSW
jgi:hypothetical protein